MTPPDSIGAGVKRRVRAAIWTAAGILPPLCVIALTRWCWQPPPFLEGVVVGLGLLWANGVGYSESRTNPEAT